MNDYFLLQQMFGGTTSGLMSAVLLAGLLVAAIFKPERIHNRTMFKRAYWLLALSIVVPGGAMLLVYLMAGSGVRPLRGGNDEMQFVFLLLAAGPICFGLSVVCAVGAILPGFIPPPLMRSGERREEGPPSLD